MVHSLKWFKTGIQTTIHLSGSIHLRVYPENSFGIPGFEYKKTGIFGLRAVAARRTVRKRSEMMLMHTRTTGHIIPSDRKKSGRKILVYRRENLFSKKKSGIFRKFLTFENFESPENVQKFEISKFSKK